jgi:hypothetical protein
MFCLSHQTFEPFGLLRLLQRMPNKDHAHHGSKLTGGFSKITSQIVEFFSYFALALFFPISQYQIRTISSSIFAASFYWP